MARVVIPYTPRYPEVHEMLESRRFCVLVAHRRFGKTVLAVNHLIRQAARSQRHAPHFGYVAPFRTQAKAVAWDYLKHFTKNFPGRKVNETELSVALPTPGGGGRVRIFGADNPDALRGLYFDGVVLDEVAQMKPDVWEEIIQPALADRQGFAVFIGTPKGVNLFSQLYFHAVEEQAKGNPAWGAMSWPVTRTNALAPEAVEDLRKGLSEAKYRQEMLCDFSASADDILITLDDAREALGRKADPELARQWPIVIGVDVARFGDDATVFFPRRGPLALAPKVMRGRSNTDVARLLAAFAGELCPAYVNIDQGQGTGVIDLVRELCPGVHVVEVPFGSQALDSRRYANRRAEMWTGMRDWLRAGGCLPGGETGQALAAELTAPTYSYDASGRIRLEAKDEIRKRLKHSTDLGDALALTFAVKTPPLAEMRGGRSGGGWQGMASGGGDYDPFV